MLAYGVCFLFFQSDMFFQWTPSITGKRMKSLNKNNVTEHFQSVSCGLLHLFTHHHYFFLSFNSRRQILQELLPGKSCPYSGDDNLETRKNAKTAASSHTNLKNLNSVLGLSGPPLNILKSGFPVWTETGILRSCQMNLKALVEVTGPLPNSLLSVTG